MKATLRNRTLRKPEPCSVPVRNSASGGMEGGWCLRWAPQQHGVSLSVIVHRPWTNAYRPPLGFLKTGDIRRWQGPEQGITGPFPLAVPVGLQRLCFRSSGLKKLRSRCRSIIWTLGFCSNYVTVIEFFPVGILGPWLSFGYFLTHT